MSLSLPKIPLWCSQQLVPDNDWFLRSTQLVTNTPFPFFGWEFLGEQLNPVLKIPNKHESECNLRRGVNICKNYRGVSAAQQPDSLSTTGFSILLWWQTWTVWEHLGRLCWPLLTDLYSTMVRMAPYLVPVVFRLNDASPNASVTIRIRVIILI